MVWIGWLRFGKVALSWGGEFGLVLLVWLDLVRSSWVKIIIYFFKRFGYSG